MLRFAALVSALALSACGGGSSIAFSDLDQALQQARCQRFARCGLYPDADYCLAALHPDPDPSPGGALTAHKLNFDGERGQACVDAIAKQSCDLTAHDAHVPPAACTEMYVGKVADGHACSIDPECASGTCDLPNDCPERQCCVGVCHSTQSPAAAGGTCTKSVDCKDGLVCGADLTCHVPAKAAQPCGSDRECDDNLACIDATSGTLGTCRTLPHKGEACPEHRCADANLRCEEDTTHTCVAFGLVGDACPIGNECSPGMECDTMTHECRKYPTLGMPCDSACSGDAYCVFDGPTANTCAVLLENNQPCDGNQQCASGFCEDGPIFRGCIDPYVCF